MSCGGRKGWEAAASLIGEGRGKQITSEIHDLVQEMQGEEQRLLKERYVEATRKFERTKIDWHLEASWVC